MKLFEFEETDLEAANYDPNRDVVNSRSIGDTRKPKLTLRHLNRLKKIRALHTLEELKRQDLFSIMYGSRAEPAGGGGMGF